MHIEENRETGVISLKTDHDLYQMQADGEGVLRHLYYGSRTESDMSYLIRSADRGFSGNPYEQRSRREYSLDTLPLEYSGGGNGDYRAPALCIRTAEGSRRVDLRCAEHRIIAGRPELPGLPYVRGDEETETLEITLRDPASGLKAILRYHVFPREDVISRSVRLVNEGREPLMLEKVMSLSLDVLYGRPDVLHFHGRHCMERQAERAALPEGVLSLGSVRGMSSHQQNPFVILCAPQTTEDAGECFGVMLMYSGNHLEEIEVSQFGSTRINAGIHPDGFSWQLAPGGVFDTPEAILSRSGEGFNALSRNFHRIIREKILPPAWRRRTRPVLLNSWEACYFDFSAEKLLQLARSAKELGAEMLVLDDGWFGKRDDDNSGLGDWQVNEKKLGCSLGELSDGIHALGLQFGLWVEPEMVSEDSDLFRKHPDWALREPGHPPVMSRNQMVLDLSRPEVTDYLQKSLYAVLDSARIEYIKWDCNRSIADRWSGALPAERQGETSHRYMMGVYRLLAGLQEHCPDLLIEGCAGGGGRFDAGMLFYCPQIWCSDDTDAVERLEIQRGTSYGYPVSTVGAHVSAVPNHQTGRTVPFHTRGVVAQSGTFGYELNPEQLTPEEKQEMKAQIDSFRRLAPLIAEGTYYRLTELEEKKDFSAWMLVSPDRREALVSFVMTHVRANGPFPWIRLKGLLPDAVYQLEETGQRLTGAALMCGGYSFPLLTGDYPAAQLHLVQVRS